MTFASPVPIDRLQHEVVDSRRGPLLKEIDHYRDRHFGPTAKAGSPQFFPSGHNGRGFPGLGDSSRSAARLP